MRGNRRTCAVLTALGLFAILTGLCSTGAVAAPKVTVAHPASPSWLLDDAARELAHYVEAITGGKLPKWFLAGFDTVYARWYCMFAPDFDQGNLMHFVQLLGGPPNNPWAAFGKAGLRPSGADFFCTGFEPWRDCGRYPPPGAMGFYTYYPDMTRDPDGHYWGNIFGTDPPFVIERGRWYCMEIMLKCNTPGRADGEQAAWIDGEKVLEVKNLQWRDVESLKAHCLWLLLYVHDSPKVNRAYFDNIALGHDYIGPIDQR